MRVWNHLTNQQARVSWVPSHGKKLLWKPDDAALALGTVDEIREWNGIL